MRIDELFSQQGRVAVVTGAASGVGKAMARALAQVGASIGLLDVNEAGLHEVEGELRSRGTEALALAADVSDAAHIEKSVASIHDHFGQVDLLFNIAGVISHGSVEETDPARWDWVLGVNLRGPFLCSRAVFPLMKARRWGRIVSIASMSGKTGGIVVGADYCASKAGVVSLTKSLAKEGAKWGILANAVSPGVIDSPMTQTHADSIDDLRAGVPLGRLAQPEEIAYAALFLCSGMADYITGQTLHVNGGMIMPD